MYPTGRIMPKPTCLLACIYTLCSKLWRDAGFADHTMIGDAILVRQCGASIHQVSGQSRPIELRHTMSAKQVTLVDGTLRDESACTARPTLRDATAYSCPYRACSHVASACASTLRQVVAYNLLEMMSNAMDCYGDDHPMSSLQNMVKRFLRPYVRLVSTPLHACETLPVRSPASHKTLTWS